MPLRRCARVFLLLGLLLSPSVSSARGVTLTWDYTVGVVPHDMFLLDRSTDGGLTWLTRPYAILPTVRTYTDKHVSSRSQYCYRLSAFSNTHGESAFSNVVCRVPKKPPKH